MTIHADNTDSEEEPDSDEGPANDRWYIEQKIDVRSYLSENDDAKTIREKLDRTRQNLELRKCEYHDLKLAIQMIG